MAAEISTKARRSLGIGYIGLAHYLAKQGYSYEQKLGWRQVDKLTEAFQYYLLKASNDLLKKKVLVNTLIEQNILMVSYQ